MHTFFINTSKKKLDEYDILFDIHYENRTLVSMDCPMGEWYDSETGYHSCVKKMSDMIDGYVELDNAFNLVIYIDLSENKAYSSITRDMHHNKERDACLCAMRILYSRIISETIVEELISTVREPQSVLILVGEDKRVEEPNTIASAPGIPEIMNKLFEFIGLPDTEAVKSIAEEVDSSDAANKTEILEKRITAVLRQELVPGMMRIYSEDLLLWYDEIAVEADVENANTSLYKRIADHKRLDGVAIEIVSCPYDYRAVAVNKSAMALSQLNIALYLLKCVETNSVYEENSDSKNKSVMEFHAYSADEVACLFKRKEIIFSGRLAQIESISQSYAELDLAPRLPAFNYGKFGLDEFGDKAVDLIFTDNIPKSDRSEAVGEEDKVDDKAGNEEKAISDEKIDIEGKDKKIDVVAADGQMLFSSAEYGAFDYTYDQGDDEGASVKTTPEQHIEYAKKVKKHHLDYLKRFKVHMSEVLSNYAGKSKENKAAILRIGGRRYANDGKTEQKSLETMEHIADKAYESMLNQYMEFCAGRSVAMTDIEQECNRFVSRIHQINQCLKKIKLVALCMLFAIVAMYIPFFIIQYDAISLNAATKAFALASVAVPLVILGAVFSKAAMAQRKKYLAVRKEFKQQSDRVLEENAAVARKYDQLLAVAIPALRWVYEFKLDVAYCAECCRVADAKIVHHKRKLYERVLAIKNILGDLECSAMSVRGNPVDPEGVIDYNVSFCAGENNIKFYSIVDKDFFDLEKN